VDQSGHALFDGDLSMGRDTIAGVQLGPGGTAEWEWFLTRQDAIGVPLKPVGPVDHYKVRCHPIDYGGPPPV